MKPILRVAALFCWSAMLCLAGSWSGYLVDSTCYAAEERNVNPTDTLTNVDRDGYREIRYCSPNKKTKSFALLQPDGSSFNLDMAGNAKAAELVRKTGKRSPLVVVIGGEMAGKAIHVGSISTVR
jgi:hypothetical protein